MSDKPEEPQLINSAWEASDVILCADRAGITMTDAQANDWLQSREAQKLSSQVSEIGMQVLTDHFVKRSL